MTKISIITAFYNGEQYLSNLLEMINKNCKNCKEVKVEYILVNDNPKKNIVIDNVDEYLFDIKIINNKKNEGIHKTRINGLNASTGEYITFLDQDDKITDDYINSQYNKLNKNTKILVANGYHEKNGYRKKIFTDIKYKDKINDLNFYVVRSPIISPGQVLIKKSVIPEFWKNNIVTNNGADDYLLWLILLNDKYTFEYNEDLIYYHCITNNNLSSNDAKMKQSVLNVAQILENTTFNKKVLKKIRLLAKSKIGRAYGFKKSFLSMIKNPLAFIYLLKYRFQLLILKTHKNNYDKINKNFVTFLSGIDPVHLKKDVGSIPYILKKHYNIDCSLLSYRESKEACVIAQEQYNLNLNFVNKKHNNFYLDMFSYLKKEAKNIDVLNLYHLDKESYFISHVYKLFNKNGIVYLKMDADRKNFDAIINNKIKKNIMLKYFCKKHYVSVESKKMYNDLKKCNYSNVLYFPNGCLNFSYDKKMKKDNILLTVGRLGTHQKATEILLQSFKEFKNNDNDNWKLKLIGPMEESFKSYFENFISENSHLKNYIEYLGEINDFEVLDKEYKKSKIFLLPSRYESFGLVLIEALSNGNYLIASDVIDPLDEIINYGKYGVKVKPDDVSDLTKKIKKSIQNYSADNELYEEMYKYCNENFDYKKNCKKLIKYLELGD